MACKGQGHPENCECPIGNFYRPYQVYDQNGQPRLRNLRSKFERDGWLFFQAKKLIHAAMGTIIHGVTLDNPTQVYFGFLDNIEIAKGYITGFRRLKLTPARVELRVFAFHGEELNFLGYDNCSDELELALKR